MLIDKLKVGYKVISKKFGEGTVSKIAFGTNYPISVYYSGSASELSYTIDGKEWISGKGDTITLIKSDLRSIMVDKKTAKEMYKSTDPNIKKLALSAYPELEETKYPKWDDLPPIQGYFVSSTSKIQICTTREIGFNYENKNVWPTEELARASLALSQLSQLKDAYNLIKTDEPKDISFINVDTYGELSTRKKGNLYKKKYLLEFNNLKLANDFFRNNEELIIQAKPLL